LALVTIPLTGWNDAARAHGPASRGRRSLPTRWSRAGRGRTEITKEDGMESSIGLIRLSPHSSE
jgi:hypothetical protein